MAIIFVPPKEIKWIYTGAIGGLVVLFLIAFSVIMLMPEFLPQKQNVSFNSGNVIINLGVLDSQKFTQLQPFEDVQMSFAYTIKTQKGNTVSGTISAANKDDAQKKLEASGYQVISVSDMATGRVNPFISY